MKTITTDKTTMSLRRFPEYVFDQDTVVRHKDECRWTKDVWYYRYSAKIYYDLIAVNVPYSGYDREQKTKFIDIYTPDGYGKVNHYEFFYDTTDFTVGAIRIRVYQQYVLNKIKSGMSVDVLMDYVAL